MYTRNKQTIKDGMLSFKFRRSIRFVCSSFLSAISVDVHSCKAKINCDGNWKNCFWPSDMINNANVSKFIKDTNYQSEKQQINQHSNRYPGHTVLKIQIICSVFGCAYPYNKQTCVIKIYEDKMKRHGGSGARRVLPVAWSEENAVKTGRFCFF